MKNGWTIRSIGALPGLPTSFHLLAVFTSDNTIISVDQTDAGPAGDKGLESPALGVWQFGQLDVDVTLWLFWAGRNGQPLGVLRVRGRGSMDPATGKVTGPATFGFFKCGKSPCDRSVRFHDARRNV